MGFLGMAWLGQEAFRDLGLVWVLQQVIVFTLAMGWWPRLRQAPVLGGFPENVDRMIEFYRANPEYISGKYLVLRCIPFVNVGFALFEAHLYAYFILVGLPLDLLLGLLLGSIPMPEWAAGGNYLFLSGTVLGLAHTLVIIPFMATTVVAWRWKGLGRESRDETVAVGEFRHRRGAVFIVLFAQVVWVADAFEGMPLTGVPRGKLGYFVLTTIFGQDWPRDGEARCVRWTRSPALSVFGGSAEERRIVRSAIDQANEALAGTAVSIQGAPENDEDAEIKVVFAPRARFAEVCERFGRPLDEDIDQRRLSGLWRTGEERPEITEVLLFFDSAGYSEDELAHDVLSLIAFYALGIPHRGGPNWESVLSTPSERGRLSELDRNIIRFYYTRIRPGDGPKEVMAALESHWP